MKIGFDYWNCVSHYPEQLHVLESALFGAGHDTVVISAVGKKRVGTVAGEVLNLWDWFDDENIHEVVFNHPKQSPELKLAKCKELGVTMFFDDRTDVVDLLNANNILAFLVPRKHKQSDIEAERK